MGFYHAWYVGTQFSVHFYPFSKTPNYCNFFASYYYYIRVVSCIKTFFGYFYSTGKSLSEALIFASTNPQYDDRLFIELQVQYMKIPSSNLGRTCCVQKLFLTFRAILVHNMFSPCSAKRRASDKDLPVMGSKMGLFKEWSFLKEYYV